MVLDRDYRDDESARQLTAKLSNRVYIWNCHEIENILLNETAMLRLLRLNGVDNFGDESALMLSMLECAKSMQELFVAQWVASRLHAGASLDDSEEDVAKPTTEENVRRLAERALKRADSTYSSASLDSVFRETRSDVQRCLRNRTGRGFCRVRRFSANFERRIYRLWTRISSKNS
jgi:hypothetical protein